MTRNGRSIVLTAVLALILVYMFSIIGYMFFRDDFLVSVDSELGSKLKIWCLFCYDEFCFKMTIINILCFLQMKLRLIALRKKR